MAAAQEGLFPCVSKEELGKAFIGKRLGDVPTPAAVLDRAVVERNCRQMLEACQALDVDFRPHVKTHKVQALLSYSSISTINECVHKYLRHCRISVLGMF